MEDQIDFQFYWSYEIAILYNLKSAELIQLVLSIIIRNLTY